jgi:hypothetical protein
MYTYTYTFMYNILGCSELGIQLPVVSYGESEPFYGAGIGSEEEDTYI